MPEFNENDINRDASGKFAAKSTGAADIDLDGVNTTQRLSVFARDHEELTPYASEHPAFDSVRLHGYGGGDGHDPWDTARVSITTGIDEPVLNAPYVEAHHEIKNAHVKARYGHDSVFIPRSDGSSEFVNMRTLPPEYTVEDATRNLETDEGLRRFEEDVEKGEVGEQVKRSYEAWGIDTRKIGAEKAVIPDLDHPNLVGMLRERPSTRAARAGHMIADDRTALGRKENIDAMLRTMSAEHLDEHDDPNTGMSVYRVGDGYVSVDTYRDGAKDRLYRWAKSSGRQEGPDYGAEMYRMDATARTMISTYSPTIEGAKERFSSRSCDRIKALPNPTNAAICSRNGFTAGFEHSRVVEDGTGRRFIMDDKASLAFFGD